VLCINSGSSSIKYAVIAGADDLARDLVGGLTDRDRSSVIADIFATVDRLDAPIAAVGHRIVHGGPDLTQHARITPEVLAMLAAAVDFAPLHLPDELAAIDAVRQRRPDLMQVACLDTAFHRTLPEVAHRYALPAAITDRGIRRYGFHGLSYEHVVHTLGAERLGRAVVAHLGSGASLAAIDHGVCVDTTMGLTPTGGVVMGTRPGDLDPGVVAHLLRTGMVADEAELTHLFNHESGLAGLSGMTSDVRTLLELRTNADAFVARSASLALEVFAYSVRKAIGSLAAALGGIDTLVFTGGVGEHAAAVRAEIVAPLAHLGLELDPSADEVDGAATDGVISTSGSRPILVVAADEEAIIARHTVRLLR
jgi:acetate kinase